MRLALPILLAFAVPAVAQTYVAPTDALSPADERKAFQLPPGFEAQLVAAEPDIGKPIQIAFDAKGRLWVTTSRHYPFPAAEGKASDKLYVLSDFGPDGKAKKITVFDDKLNIPVGILPLPDCKSCIVSSVGRIWKLTDTDDDGKADKREILLSGFG
ncbi:MAG TPA: sorbosone dehydrogenase, partial [Fimbriiglobus sp.]|nr:sorbosone dehydrogenase [Fimbriiglobus sp.]